VHGQYDQSSSLALIAPKFRHLGMPVRSESEAVMRGTRTAFCRAAVVCAGILFISSMPGAARAQEDSTSAPGPVVPIAVRSDPGPEFVVGCTEYVLKYGFGTGTQGSWGALDLPSCPEDACGGTGIIRYRCLWANGCLCPIDTGSCVPVFSGNVSGSTASAIQQRFSVDTDQREGICSSDYTGNGLRMIVAAITTSQGTGSCPGYEVLRFARFFLTRIPGTGNTSFIYVNFLGYGKEEPTAARATTWGRIKQIYR
jgi:hypothetical protein